MQKYGRISHRVLLGVFLLTAAGCQSDAASDPYAGEFTAATAGATSEFEREALADGEITQQEYVDAHERWLICMEQTYPPDGGKVVSLRLGEDGLYQYVATGFVPGDETVYDATSKSCEKGTTEFIGPLYGAIATNPERRDPNELVVECLRAIGLVDADYTTKNYLADLAKGSAGSVTENYDANTGVTTRTTEAPEYNADHATDLDIHDERVESCILDPHR